MSTLCEDVIRIFSHVAFLYFISLLLSAEKFHLFSPTDAAVILTVLYSVASFLLMHHIHNCCCNSPLSTWLTLMFHLIII